MIIILQHVAHEPPGVIGEVFDDWNLPYKVIRLYEGESVPGEDTDLEGLIAMGGPMGVSDEDKYDWLKPEKALIRHCIRNQIPFLGICLGCQLLANALDCEVYPAPKKEIGWMPISWTPEARMHPYFGHFPDQQVVFQWHGDTFDLPMGAMRLATSEICPNQAFAYGPRIVGLQFHLEVTGAIVKDWLTREENQPDLEALNEPIEDQLRYTSIYLNHLNGSGRPLIQRVFMG